MYSWDTACVVSLCDRCQLHVKRHPPRCMRRSVGARISSTNPLSVSRTVKPVHTTTMSDICGAIRSFPRVRQQHLMPPVKPTYEIRMKKKAVAAQCRITGATIEACGADRLDAIVSHLIWLLHNAMRRASAVPTLTHPDGGGDAKQ